MCKPNAYHYRSLQYKISGLNILDTVDPSTSNSQVYGHIALIGIGAGIFIQTSFSVAQAKVPQKHASDAGIFIALAQNRGSVMALAIFQNTAVKNLHLLLPDIPKNPVKQATLRSESSSVSVYFFKAVQSQCEQSFESWVLK